MKERSLLCSQLGQLIAGARNYVCVYLYDVRT